ncbi:hypothetical protein EYB25_000399 [Talaromyces marneffei]|uniref:6-hydroxynicotinate 3-monooxygenase n=1 Tax=Talaromyces marneffei PM1 TaxID=1077442 RepID=A0A093Y1J7_TALMA|nr:hypothetical protein EYB25_000399 [Talaromyces marneffei]
MAVIPATENPSLPPRGHPVGISALIVGAGVAGLLCALELWRQGIEVQIIERSPSRNTSGDGFSISYNIIRSLRNWPYMAKKNEEIAFHSYLAWHNNKGERVTEPIKLEIEESKGPGIEEEEEEKSGPSHQVYRHSRPLFHLMLDTQLQMIGLKVQYGKRAIRYIDEDPEQGTKAAVELDTGEIIEADVVIAADGVGGHSTKATLGHEVPARSTGHAIYRAAFPVEIVLSDPELAERFKLLPDGSPVAELWIGEGIAATFGRTQSEMGWSLRHKASQDSAESWSKYIAPQQVIDDTTSKIEGWPEYANRLILMTPKDKLLNFELVWRDPQPIWTSKSGRIVQIGDAAHTFLPSSGNGANQALEDAISLAKCLAIAGKDNIGEATKVHNKLRFERVSCLQKVGIINQATGYGQNDKNNQIASDFKPIPKYVKALMAPWVVKHDPEQYAAEKYHKALAALKSGDQFESTNIPRGYDSKPWNFEELLKIVQEGGEMELNEDWYK